MRKFTAITTLAVAGLASAAAAQSGSLSIVGAPATFNWTVESVFTVDIVANADFGTHVSGGAFTTQLSGAVSQINGVNASAASWAAVGENDFGYDNNGLHEGLVFGQVVFPPFFPPSAESALPGTVVAQLQFEVAAGFIGPLTIQLGARDAAPFVLEIYNEGDESFTQLGASDISFGSASIFLIPAPSSAAVLGLGALCATRRRR